MRRSMHSNGPGARRSLREPAEFQPWFDRILVNVCRDRSGRRRRLTFVAIVGVGDHLAGRDDFAAVDDRDTVVRALRDLADRLNGRANRGS
jgi:DNA-directed RNA polymerase specialized sigma24 family protein